MTEYQFELMQGGLGLFVRGNLVLAAALFCIGLVGFFMKQNAISLFMCIELMINAANLVFVTFALMYGHVTGAIIFLFVITVAAAEAGVGLAIFISMSRTEAGIDVRRTVALAEQPPAPSERPESKPEKPAVAA